MGGTQRLQMCLRQSFCFAHFTLNFSRATSLYNQVNWRCVTSDVRVRVAMALRLCSGQRVTASSLASQQCARRSQHEAGLPFALLVEKECPTQCAEF